MKVDKFLEYNYPFSLLDNASAILPDSDEAKRLFKEQGLNPAWVVKARIDDVDYYIGGSKEYKPMNQEYWVMNI